MGPVHPVQSCHLEPTTNVLFLLFMGHNTSTFRTTVDINRAPRTPRAVVKASPALCLMIEGDEGGLDGEVCEQGAVQPSDERGWPRHPRLRLRLSGGACDSVLTSRLRCVANSSSVLYMTSIACRVAPSSALTAFHVCLPSYLWLDPMSTRIVTAGHSPVTCTLWACPTAPTCGPACHRLHAVQHALQLALRGHCALSVHNCR